MLRRDATRVELKMHLRAHTGAQRVTKCLFVLKRCLAAHSTYFLIWYGGRDGSLPRSFCIPRWIASFEFFQSASLFL